MRVPLLICALTLSSLAGCGTTGTVLNGAPNSAATGHMIPSTGTTPRSKPMATCSPSSLRLTNLNILWQYTGGGNGAYFSVQNTTGRICRLDGYLPIAVDGRVVVHGSNFFGVEAGDLRPGRLGHFGFVQENTQTRAVVRCAEKRQPLLREVVTLAGRYIGTVAVNRCFNLWMTPVGL